jgi:hypothetical protein
VAKRDEFPVSVVRVLGQRAGYLCSNPDCRRPTAGPHSDPAKAQITGEAAHICAAAVGGPRYDATQTPEERKAITNGLWLCSVCAKKIDTDREPWPKERLHKMKDDHEAWIAAEGMIPGMPQIALATRSGLRLDPKVPNIDAAVLDLFREQELTIRNPNRVDLFTLKLSMYFPEAVIRYGQPTHNAGTKIVAMAVRSAWTVDSVQEGGAVLNTEPAPTPNHTLDIQRIGANENIAIPFFTVSYYQMMLIPNSQPIPGPVQPVPMADPDSLAETNALRWFLHGSFQFLLRGEYVTNEILVPLRYKFKDRKIASLPCESSAEKWHLAPANIFPGMQFKS